MAGQNRHLRGDMNEIKIPVHSDVTVEPGDFLVIGGVVTVDQSGRAADYYAYPFSSVSGAVLKGGVSNSLNVCKQWFVGVAMSGSASGVTDDINVATDGIFRYPYNNAGTVTAGTTIGYKVSAVTAPAKALGAGVSAQAVSLQLLGGTSAYVGYVAENHVGGTSFVDFRIHTKYGLGLIS